MNIFRKKSLLIWVIVFGLLVIGLAFIVTWFLDQKANEASSLISASLPPASPNPSINPSICVGNKSWFNSFTQALEQSDEVCHLIVGGSEAVTNEIAMLRNLQTLVIAQNDQAQLPAEIGNLSNLLFLDVSNSKNLSSLPAGMTNLQTLKLLNIRGTKINKMPQDIGRLAQLKQIIMDQGQLGPQEVFRIKSALPNIQIVEFDPGQSGGVFFAG